MVVGYERYRAVFLKFLGKTENVVTLPCVDRRADVLEPGFFRTKIPLTCVVVTAIVAVGVTLYATAGGSILWIGQRLATSIPTPERRSRRPSTGRCPRGTAALVPTSTRSDPGARPALRSDSWFTAYCRSVDSLLAFGHISPPPLRRNHPQATCCPEIRPMAPSSRIASERPRTAFTFLCRRILEDERVFLQSPPDSGPRQKQQTELGLFSKFGKSFCIRLSTFRITSADEGPEEVP